MPSKPSPRTDTGALVDAMQQYYAQRADQYDQSMGYTHPGFLHDNTALFERLRACVAGRKILEIGCGPGFWTEQLYPAVTDLWATDFSTEVLQMAAGRKLPPDRVHWQQADAYRLEGLPHDFTGAFFCDWWSHIPYTRIPTFLDALHRHLLPGARVVILEAFPGAHASFTSPLPAGQDRDPEGNRLIQRRLKNGREFVIIKNYWSREDYAATLTPRCKHWQYDEIEFIAYVDGNPQPRRRVLVDYEV